MRDKIEKGITKYKLENPKILQKLREIWTLLLNYDEEGRPDCSTLMEIMTKMEYMELPTRKFHQINKVFPLKKKMK